MKTITTLSALFICLCLITCSYSISVNSKRSKLTSFIQKQSPPSNQTNHTVNNNINNTILDNTTYADYNNNDYTYDNNTDFGNNFNNTPVYDNNTNVDNTPVFDNTTNFDNTTAFDNATNSTNTPIVTTLTAEECTEAKEHILEIENGMLNIDAALLSYKRRSDLLSERVEDLKSNNSTNSSSLIAEYEKWGSEIAQDLEKEYNKLLDIYDGIKTKLNTLVDSCPAVFVQLSDNLIQVKNTLSTIKKMKAF